MLLIFFWQWETKLISTVVGPELPSLTLPWLCLGLCLHPGQVEPLPWLLPPYFRHTCISFKANQLIKTHLKHSQQLLNALVDTVWPAHACYEIITHNYAVLHHIKQIGSDTEPCLPGFTWSVVGWAHLARSRCTQPEIFYVEATGHSDHFEWGDPSLQKCCIPRPLFHSGKSLTQSCCSTVLPAGKWSQETCPWDRH